MLGNKIVIVGAIALAAIGSIGVFLRVVEWSRRKAPRGRTDPPPPEPINCRCVLDPTGVTLDPQTEAVIEQIAAAMGLSAGYVRGSVKSMLAPRLEPAWIKAICDKIRDEPDDLALARVGFGAKLMDPTPIFPFVDLAGPEPSIWGPPRLAIDHWKRSWWGLGRRWKRIVAKVWVEYRAAPQDRKRGNL